MAQPKDLYEFLVEAELQHYYDGFRKDLKVTTVLQLKYVEEEDLVDMGMTKPEMRRLKKFFKKEYPQGTFSKLRKILKGNESPSSPTPPDRSVHIHRTPGKHIISEEAISILKTLGTGEFGTVQQGVWTTDEGDRVQVAIKCLAKNKIEQGMTDFLKEATIMHTIDHPHIVRLFGVVLGSQKLMLVTELAPLRSLLECLKEPALRASFSVLQLCDFTLQIAQGMEYLESKRFIHRDLAARNILVFAKDKVKISDFGLSRALGVGKDYYQTNFNINLKLPIAWCAPECINYLKFTSASDIWAFGVALWEMFSYGFQPWAGFTGQQILDAIDEPNLQRLDNPDICPRMYYDLILKCWEHIPESRPKFSEVVAQLSMMKPERMQALRDALGVPSKNCLQYKATDILTVLDRKCQDSPSPGFWKGITDTGKVGYFDSSNVAPYIDVKTSPGHRKVKLSRKESGRKSGRGLKAKLHAGLIGNPQADLRHTGHIGYDGAMFGDVSFIGDNYNKLPVKVITPTRRANGSMCSLSNAGDGFDDFISQSEFSMTSERTESMLTGLSMGSQDDTLTDVSSMISELDLFTKSISDDRSMDRYEDIDDDLDSFKMPDLDLGIDLDLGPSFMDEVMKAITSNKESPSKSEETLLSDKSPLIEQDAPFKPSRMMFDNVAMVTENEFLGTDNETDSDKTKEGSTKGSLSSNTSLEYYDNREQDLPIKEGKKKKVPTATLR